MSAAARRGFVTAGTWCLDRNRMIDRWPHEDSIGTAWGLEERGGGSACNFAIDMRRLDNAMPVATIGLVGDDTAGQSLVAEADRAGIEHSHMAIEPGATTHITDAFVSERSGLRTHITDLGIAAKLSPAHFNIDGLMGKYFHLGLPGVHPAMDAPWQGEANGWVSVLHRAREAGFLTNMELCSLAPERLRMIVRPCLPLLDLLIVNDHEIGALADMATVQDECTDIGACEQAVQRVFELGSMALIAVHFPAGAVGMTRDGASAFVPSAAIPQAEIVGPNGAGDAFAAGCLYGLHEDWPLPDALWMGHAAASCSLRHAGTTDGVLSWRDCLAAADRWGRRQASSTMRA